MQGKSFTLTVHAPGTMGADINYRLLIPFDCSLIHISAVVSGANQAGLTVGNSVTAAAYLAKASVGASNVPVEFDRDDFVGTPLQPHIVLGTILVVAVDFDYNNGGGAVASANLTVVFTFTEG